MWKVEEDHNDPQYADLVKSFKGKSDKRRREELGGALLLERLEIRDKIVYLENGKPTLPGVHISISHSDDIVGLAVGEKPVGLDIQDDTPKLFNIKHKFCNDEELRMWSDDLDRLTLIWAGKESVFKIYGEDLAFAEEMHVHFPVQPPKWYECTSLKHKRTYILDWLTFEGKRVVWTRS
ncbi:MAG: 4'-phosphopantetheinyl transferase superfamily protein [Flavobacteriales bacterium]|nr:4'-phosphopantetheinyl transferase superfamily protein [Flavobacteriales bacterium]